MIVPITSQYFPFDFQQWYSLTNYNYEESNQEKIGCFHLIVSQPWFSRTVHLQGRKRQNEGKKCSNRDPFPGKGHQRIVKLCAEWTTTLFFKTNQVAWHCYKHLFSSTTYMQAYVPMMKIKAVII